MRWSPLAVADALLPTLHALLCFCWPVQHMPLPSLWSSLTEVIRKVPQLPSTAPGGQEASECSSLCTLISTKGYSLWAAAPELAQQERKSSRCLILEPVCVQVWCICPSPVLCGCVHALMLHTHIHSQSGIPQESLRWPTSLSVTVVHCLTGMDVEGIFRAILPPWNECPHHLFQAAL